MRENEVFDLWEAAARFRITENDLYMDCLALVNEVLSLVNLNEANLHFC